MSTFSNESTPSIVGDTYYIESSVFETPMASLKNSSSLHTLVKAFAAGELVVMAGVSSESSKCFLHVLFERLQDIRGDITAIFPGGHLPLTANSSQELTYFNEKNRVNLTIIAGEIKRRQCTHVLIESTDFYRWDGHSEEVAEEALYALKRLAVETNTVVFVDMRRARTDAGSAPPDYQLGYLHNITDASAVNHMIIVSVNPQAEAIVRFYCYSKIASKAMRS